MLIPPSLWQRVSPGLEQSHSEDPTIASIILVFSRRGNYEASEQSVFFARFLEMDFSGRPITHISLQSLQCGPSGLKWAWTRSPAQRNFWGLENTAKKCAFRTCRPRKHANKNMFSQHASAAARKAENTQKQVFLRCGGFRRPRCDVEQARKNTCFRPLCSEKTHKNACFFEGRRRKHVKTFVIRHIGQKRTKTRKNTCFFTWRPFRALWQPPGGTAGDCWDAGGGNHAFLRVSATPVLEKPVFLHVFGAPEVPLGRRPGPGRAPAGSP